MKKRRLFELVLALFTLAFFLWISIPRFLNAQKMAPIWSKKALIRHIAENLSRQPNPLQFLIDTQNYSKYTMNKHIYLLNIYSRSISRLETNDLFPESPFPLGKTEKENYKIWIDVMEKAGLSDVVSDTNLWEPSTNQVVYFRVYRGIVDQNRALITPPPGLPIPNSGLNLGLMNLVKSANIDSVQPHEKLFDPSNGVTSGGLLLVDSIDLGWSLAPELKSELIRP